MALFVYNLWNINRTTGLKLKTGSLPMFYVNIDPNSNNKIIVEIHEINRFIVQIEGPKSTEEIVQKNGGGAVG